MKRLAILGSTGSIGRSALAVVDAHPERLRVVALAAGDNAALLAEQVARYQPDAVAMATADGVDRLRASAGSLPPIVACGPEGLIAVATQPCVDIVLCASSGTAGLEAVLAAIEAGKTIALANKEVLVMAGELVMSAARRRGIAILPVDSEHNAIHQCLHGRSRGEVRRLILTASGGPFREMPPEALEHVTPAAALQHPTWRMGREDHDRLGHVDEQGPGGDRGTLAVRCRPGGHRRPHPPAVDRALDGGADRRLGHRAAWRHRHAAPDSVRLLVPERWEAPLPSLDIAGAGRLDFSLPLHDRFPCLGLAYDALRTGGTLPVVLNAANEIAVELFLDGKLGFMSIPRVLRRTMDAHRVETMSTLEVVRRTDAWARAQARVVAGELELNGLRSA